MDNFENLARLPSIRPTRHRPRASHDAARPAAVDREELDRERPLWLPNNLPMPSRRVWQDLTIGRTFADHTVFMSVVLGLVNAGWTRPYVERALRENARVPGTPGAWWLHQQGGRTTELERALAKAHALVRRSPPDPTLLKSGDPDQEFQVREFVTRVEQAILNGARSSVGPLLPEGPDAVRARIAIFGILSLALDHAAALAVTESGSEVSVVVASRDLAMKINSTQAVAADALRLLARSDSDEPASYSGALLRLQGKGRDTDAHTYTLTSKNIRPRLRRVPSQTELHRSHASPQRDMTCGVPRSLMGPDLTVLSHDAFVTNASRNHGATRSGLGKSLGLITALIAANGGGLSVKELSVATGLGEPAVRKQLRRAHTEATERPRSIPLNLLERGATGARFESAYLTTAGLIDRLDDIADELGSRGTGVHRRAEFESQRTDFAAHLTADTRKPPASNRMQATYRPVDPSCPAVGVA